MGLSAVKPTDDLVVFIPYHRPRFGRLDIMASYLGTTPQRCLPRGLHYFQEMVLDSAGNLGYAYQVGLILEPEVNPLGVLPTFQSRWSISIQM